MTNELVARASPTGTTLAVSRATSPVRLLRTQFPGTRAATVCIVTFGGGLVDGDAIAVDLEVEEGAVLVVFTQASTKVFRGAASQTIRAKVAGTLVLLPDPVACFKGATFHQRIEIDLAGAGACVSMDGFTSGRPAFGERWAFTCLDTRTVIRRDGALVLEDALHLQRPAEQLGRFEAFAAVTAVGAAPIVRGLLASPIVTPELVAAPSPLPRATDGAIVRIAGTSPALVLAEARSRLGNLPDIDAVDPFGARS